MNGAKLPKQYAEPFNKIQLFPDRLLQPLRWKKPQRIFVNSMSDLFHKDIPFKYIDQVFAVMALTPRHTYQVLTKRPERMLQYFQSMNRAEMIECWQETAYELTKDDEAACFVANRLNGVLPNAKPGWAIQNVWLGTSVENQKTADERIPLLLQTPAAVRFLSCEPLLGMVDLKLHDSLLYHTSGWWPPLSEYTKVGEVIDWVIVGGESGSKARPMHPDWVRSIRDQCAEFNIPFFFKQYGEYAPIHELRTNEPGIKGKLWVNFDPDTSVCRVGKKKAGRLLDGQEWSQFPDAEYQDCGECSCK
ncbi:phage protein Gp37/Gp68 [Aneurinibacillus aneurinilyticus ATCC 12856]|uniref:Phage protein Gp37/Gp68 n=2 Tax=Aneurinibacillus aneurinilyticus TaxID=1391 RepID=U1YFQ3_ANEAE|nr:phage protein Gp37/Gp68 [Aneurinibacillus aneurinilyticus ATCC 12856]